MKKIAIGEAANAKKIFEDEAREVLAKVLDLDDRFSKVDNPRSELNCYKKLFKFISGMWQSEGDDDGSGLPWSNYEVVIKEGGLECRIHGDKRNGKAKTAGFRWRIMCEQPPQSVPITRRQRDACIRFVNVLLAPKATEMFKKVKGVK